MISVEVELPTISLAAFLCAIGALPGGLLGVLLAARPGYGGDLGIRVTSCLTGAFLLLAAVAFASCGFLPQRLFPLLLLLLSAVGTVGSGVVWTAFRMGIEDASVELREARRMEVACLATWMLGVVIVTAFLAVAATHITLVSAAAKEPPSPLSYQDSPSSGAFGMSEKFSDTTLSSRLGSTRRDNAAFEGGAPPPLDEPSAMPAVGIVGAVGPPRAQLPRRSASGSARIGMAIVPGPIPPAASNGPAQHPMRKLHKKSSSFLSFLDAASATVPKPMLRAHHKSDSLLSKFNPRHSVMRSRASLSGLDAIPTGFAAASPGETAPLDSWDLSSEAARDRLAWTLAHAHDVASTIQSRAVSGSSKSSEVSSANAYNHLINHAGFAKDPRPSKRGLRGGGGVRMPSDPLSWFSDSSNRTPPKARLAALDSPTDERSPPLAQYDRERLYRVSVV